MQKTEKDLQELQEVLILIYKFVQQEKLYEKFFFEDSDFQRPYKYKNKLINELLEMDDSLDFLKTCIIEVEALKEKKLENEIDFINILEKYEIIELLLVKYGLSNLEEVDKLNTRLLLNYF
jgi:hypothetical protein